MKTYTVTKTYKYTETVEVTADSKREAEDAAMHFEGERNHDDWLYSCDAVESKEHP